MTKEDFKTAGQFLLSLILYDQLLLKYIKYELEYRPKIRLTDKAMESAMISVLKELDVR